MTEIRASLHALSPLSANLHKRLKGDIKIAEQDEICARLTWTDLSVVVNSNQVVLSKVCGYAEPGRLVAIMGPSGSGKSTLLDSLAGRPSKNANVSGEVLLNGRKEKLSHGTVAYVAQDDVLLGTLTVYETLMFSARLRFPDAMTFVETEQIVKSTISDVGLQESINTPIGNWHQRGLSGGEKRRVSIAVELLTRPRLLFLDEPTSGLDSASAFHVVSTLRNLARDGRTVLASIHQPSSEVFELFDDLCLLSGGRQVYFGPLNGAQDFFANAGFPCPPMRNPSDHYLRVTNSDFDKVNESLTMSSSFKFKRGDEENQYLNQYNNSIARMSTAEQVRVLTHLFATSEEKKAVMDNIATLTSLGGKVLPTRGTEASFFRQSWVLSKRSLLNMTRDAGYYWLRLAMYIVQSFCVGMIFYKAGTKYDSIMARASCMSYMVGFMTFMSIGGFPSFVEDMKVFQRERLNGHYGVAPFVIGNTVSSFPYLFLIALVSTIITYFMVGFHPGFDRFAYFVLSLLACLAVVESLMMAVASVVPNFLMGIITGAGIQGMFLLLSGFFRLPNDYPKIFWKYPMFYVGFHMYALQGEYQNDFLGLTFSNVSPSLPPLTGEYILKNTYQIDLSRNKWWNLLVLFTMSILYRLIFYTLIRFSESVMPAIRAYIATRMYAWHLKSCGVPINNSVSPEL
ncbi:unnamed protein product [Calypogeia fissa]